MNPAIYLQRQSLVDRAAMPPWSLWGRIMNPEAQRRIMLADTYLPARRALYGILLDADI